MPPREETLIFQMNETSFQRPDPIRIVKDFSFWGLTNDLYKAYEFVRESKGFEHVWLGNKRFELENQDPQLSYQNIAPLRLLLKKT